MQPREHKNGNPSRDMPSVHTLHPMFSQQDPRADSTPHSFTPGFLTSPPKMPRLYKGKDYRDPKLHSVKCNS